MQGYSPLNTMPPMATIGSNDVPNFVPQLAAVPPVPMFNSSFSRSPSVPMYTVGVPYGQPLQVPAGYTAVVMTNPNLMVSPMQPPSSDCLPRDCPQIHLTNSGVAQMSQTISPAGPPSGGLFIQTTPAKTPDWRRMTQMTNTQDATGLPVSAVYSQSRSLSVASDVNELPVMETERERSPSYSFPRMSSPGPYSTSRSASSRSMRSVSPMGEAVPKRQLIEDCRAHFRAMPVPYDEIGNRGENVVRIKVKTRNALENIIPFMDSCIAQGLLTKVSCPISTKKGRQHIRGFLAYLECTNTTDVQNLFNAYNEKYSCFKPIEVNPPSKRPYNPTGSVGAMGN